MQTDLQFITQLIAFCWQDPIIDGNHARLQYHCNFSDRNLVNLLSKASMDSDKLPFLRNFVEDYV
jgi:hypothetical protein